MFFLWLIFSWLYVFFTEFTPTYLNFSTFSRDKFPITFWFYTTFFLRDVIYLMLLEFTCKPVSLLAFMKISVVLLLIYTYKGQPNENRTPATKWQWNLYYWKVIARSVNTFIPLGDETINTSLVERGRSLMDPQPHLLLQFLIQVCPSTCTTRVVPVSGY